MKRLFFPAAVFLFGLSLCQVLFTAIVYAANLRLHGELVGMKAAGYLVIPNELVMPSLLHFLPALCGALFFTLTTGSGLTLAAFFAAWVQKRVFPSSRIYRLAVAAVWMALLAACNLNGWNLPATLVFFLLPPAVFAASLLWMPEPSPKGGYVNAAHIAVVVITAAAWLPCLKQDAFISIRDYLLLSNPVGKQVNAFYYKYTPYPANVIQPLASQLIKPCRIDGAGSRLRHRQMTERLVSRDYLPVSAEAPATLLIRTGNSRLRFFAGGCFLMETDVASFLSAPGQTLKTVSEMADRAGFLRQATFLGLIAGFPLGLYILVHAGLCVLLGLVRSEQRRSLTASGLCLVLAAAVLIALYAAGDQAGRPDSIHAALRSQHWYQQRNALKAIAKENRHLRIDGMEVKLADSPHVPVRYWLARALGDSDSARSRELLKNLTADPSPNVACMAFAGLGRTGDERTVDFIRTRIREIPHWYVQQYAYNAMRRLGWKQKP